MSDYDKRLFSYQTVMALEMCIRDRLTSPLELAEYKSAIMEAMFKGTKRNVESENNSKEKSIFSSSLQAVSVKQSITAITSINIFFM